MFPEKILFCQAFCIIIQLTYDNARNSIHLSQFCGENIF